MADHPIVQSSRASSTNRDNGKLEADPIVEDWLDSIKKTIIGRNPLEILCGRRQHTCSCVEGVMSKSNDSGLDDLLRKIITCARRNQLNGEIEKEIDNNLKTLLEERIFQSNIVSRAKLFSRLIAVALQLRPADISSSEDDKPESVNDFSWKEIDVKLGSAGRKLSRSKVPYGGNVSRVNTVMSYLCRELEKDDDIMTLIYTRPSHFKMYPVPYFDGCTLKIVEEVSKLWLSVSVLHCYHFKDIIDNIIKRLDLVERHDTKNIASMKEDFMLPRDVLTDNNFIKAKDILWSELQKRGAKAGARLLWLLMIERHDKPMVEELVKEMFSRPCDRQFKDLFLVLNRDYWSKLRDVRGYNDTDQEMDGEGQSISIGLPSSHTDYNLLCWAARRGYVDLIWLVAQIYKPSSKSDPYNYVNHVLEGAGAWKCALWCATRQGQTKAIHELLAPNWITDTIDFNDYPWGWLPPLHLVALLGDVILFKHLVKVHSGIKAESGGKESSATGANKKDYLGRTPLDYAMAFMRTTSKIIIFCSKPFKKDNKLNKKGQKDVVKKLLHICGVEERLKELYGMYVDQANTVLIGAALIASVTFVGWLQPPQGYSNSYVAIDGHLFIQVFVVFNTLSFFLAIATMFVGAEATLFVRDKHERTRALIEMRISVRWMMRFFISSMLSIMGAFVYAGLAVLPPIQKLKWSMMISLCVGVGICLIPLSWILWSLSENRIKLFFTRSPKLYPLKDQTDNNRSLVYTYPEEECRALFDDWDEDKDGYITARELLNIKSGDIQWEEVEVHEMIKKADVDGNYRLDYEEFRKMYVIMPSNESDQPSSSCNGIASHTLGS